MQVFKMVRMAMSDLLETDVSARDPMLAEVAGKVEREVTALNQIAVKVAVRRILGLGAT
jgi:hypothetical protein